MSLRLRRLTLLTLAGFAAAGAVTFLLVRQDAKPAAAAACPPGQAVMKGETGEMPGEAEREREQRAAETARTTRDAGEPGRDAAESDRERPAGEADRGEGEADRGGDYAERFLGRCAPLRHPESGAELARMSNAASLRYGAGSPGELVRGLRQRDRLAARARSAAEPIPGTGGTWRPLGTTPLIGDDPAYPAANGDGFGRINGRVSDFAYVPSTKTVYAAVAQGGLWASHDLGGHWHPVGDTLPIGSIGGVGYTPAGGGTLIVATGDHAFSNDYAGVGVFWSTDGGTTWVKAKGAPDGALAFRVAVDPTDPKVVYVATGLGLYRSDDAGRSFANVRLPTGECEGDSLRPNCFFANVVTDVAVQPSDSFGHKGGAVVAAVGWRDGRRPNFNGKPEAPANGVYRSDTGEPGTFRQIPDAAGFTPSAKAGRAEFGVSDGPGQNSNFLYAISQDADLFNTTVSGGEDDIPLVGTPSVLDGIYVSKDFGKTWTLMESRREFFNPANGSALGSLVALGIAPGYQVTYNQWIKPDPTRQLNGVPTRVLLGMEEVWQTASTRTPQDGHSQFLAFGAYTANGGACLVVPEQCGTVQQAKQFATTTHPDQHGSILIPDGKGGVTMLVGNDGGVYRQSVGADGEFTQLGWGSGANEGFHTLLPYSAAMSKDGTVYAGLQDNGELKIAPDGKQYATYVGDGAMSLVDPEDSNVAYGELPNAGTYKTTDGGHSWESIDPQLTNPDFIAPLVMDPGNAKHLVTAGREIAESLAGKDTTGRSGGALISTSPKVAAAETDWTISYDLGTRNHPGEATAANDDKDDPNNHATALSVNGDAIYAGFCGSCDPVKLKQRFHNGIATNVGGSKPPKATTGDGWHIAAAKGLPNRLITSMAQDPGDPRTVYVTLGASAARFFAPIGSMGEPADDAGAGHLFKSTDAGETFADISGDLPDVQATWVLPRNGQLIVGTAIGAFASPGTDGGRFAALGSGLPPVAIASLSLKPGDPNTLVAATFGRGVYAYQFDDPHQGSAASVNGAPVPGPGCRDTAAPASRIATRTARASRSRGLRLSGTASDRGCGKSGRGTVKRVTISVAKASGKRCRYVNPKGGLGKARSCVRPRYLLRAKGTTRWRITLRKRLPAGTYRVWVRAVDAAGNTERAKRKGRNVATLRARR